MNTAKKRPLKMRTKIMISSVICILLALVLQTVLFYRSSSQIIYAQAQEINSNTMENLQDDLYSFNKSIENSMIKIYNQNEFKLDMSEGSSVSELQSAYKSIAYDLARNEFTQSQNVTSLYIYSLDDKLISSYHHAQTPTYQYPADIYDGTTDFDEELIQSYIASDERVMLITSYYNPYREVNLVRYVINIYRNSTESMGYIVCDVDPKSFVSLLEKYRYSDSQIMWLQPLGGDVAITAGEMDPEDGAFEEAALAIAGGDSPDDFESTSYELFSAAERKYNFNVYSLIPHTLLKLNQTALFNTTIIVAVLAVLLLVVMSSLMSNLLTKPLTYVVVTMQRIKSGNTKLRLKSMKQDEIGILGREFNEMLDEIENLLSRELEIKMSLNNAKYKALQAQVDPHFLYNTLNTMSGIAGAQNCNVVAALCRALSNIFRYSLNMKEPYATLEEEIVHIKNYMYIMNVRMDGSLQLHIDIPNELLGKSVPRLSIQPLVENAITHGLINKRGEKHITISAKLACSYLEICAEDNGVGMDADEINNYLQSSVNMALQKKSSIGLDNINARIKLLFGNEFGVAVQSEKGEGSRVTITLPIGHDKLEDGSTL